MKKKLFTLLVCAFAVIGANAGHVDPNDNTVWIITPSDNNDTEPAGTCTTVKLVGDFTSGWSSGWLINGGSTSKANITKIDLSEANLSGTTATTEITTKTVQLEGGGTKDVEDLSTTFTNTWQFKNFTGNSALEIVWPDPKKVDAITAIPPTAFFGCTAITAVEIPNTVEIIGTQAFSGCTKLASLTYEKTPSVKYFCEESFKNTALSSVTIPGSARFIEMNAFVGIDELKTITFAKECTDDLFVAFHAFDNSKNVIDVFVLTTAKIKCANDAFEDDDTNAHGNIKAPKATLHFPDEVAAYYTNLGHPLTTDIAQDPGRFQKWLVDHYQQAQTDAQDNNNGWWEFVNAGGGDPDDPGMDSERFLKTYSHATYSHIVPDGVKAYIVNDLSFNGKMWEVTLKSISVIPPRTGVILFGVSNSNAPNGKPSLSMNVVTLAKQVDGMLYKDGDPLPDGSKMDLALRRSTWANDGFNNYLEPTCDASKETIPLAPYDTKDGKVTFRNFGFGRYKKTSIYSSGIADYAGFFRCKKNSSILSGTTGKAYLKLAVTDEFDGKKLAGDELELIIKADPNYELRAKAYPETGYIDERSEGYWKYTVNGTTTQVYWTDEESFGVRNSSLPAKTCYDVFANWYEPEPYFVEDEVTGVAKIIIPASSVETYYNLNGQQVANPTKGVYIKNGKKVIVK